jgi:AraC-like DNA-binding protein
MSEFASLAMIRVLERGMFELGIGPTPNQRNSHFAHSRGGKVDIDAKRDLLMHAIREGGVQCLPQLGRGVQHFAYEPTHRAMTSASTPIELFHRWQRLEKYIHSLHRIELLDVGENQIGLVHQSKQIATKPELTESLVVIGVLAALIRSMGAQNVKVLKCGIPVYPELRKKDVVSQKLNDPTCSWVFSWTAVNKNIEELTDSIPSQLFDASDLPPLAKQVGNACVKDLIAAPTLALIAQKMATSPRSLQRRLSEYGLSYSWLLAEARRRMAAWRLIATPGSLSEIGFCSGYTDQAHFTRDFGSRVGLTPAQYRIEFATGR